MQITVAPDFRDLFPPLTDDEFQQLKANNRDDPEHEHIPPIAIWQCDKSWIVIEGHHTQKARKNMRVNGKPVKIRYRKMDFPDRQSAMAYAIRAQLGRRNLSTSQIAIAIAKLPKAKRGPKPENNLWPNLATNRNALAKERGISRHTVKHADKVVEHGAKAIKDAVTAGDVSVSDAAAVVDLPKTDQTAAVKAVKQGKSKTLKAAAGKTTKRRKTPPKKLDPKAYYKQWHDAMGPLQRAVDRISRGIGQPRAEWKNDIFTHLQNATDAMERALGIAK